MADEPQDDGVDAPDGTTASDEVVAPAAAAADVAKNGWPTWAKATAIVTVVAVLVAGIGLVAGSHTSKQKAHAATVDLSGTVDIIKPFTAKFVGQKLLGGAAGAAGSAIFSSVLTAFGVSQADAETKEILDRVKQMQAQLDQLSRQVDALSQQVTAVSQQVEDFRRAFDASDFRTDNEAVRTIALNLQSLFAYYSKILCAREVELQSAGLHVGAGTVDSTQCPGASNRPKDQTPTESYVAQFMNAYNANLSMQNAQTLLHEKLQPTFGSPTLLARMVRTQLGGRKYFTTKDSLAVRNYYETIAENEALAAYLVAEYYSMAGLPDAGQKALLDWNAARTAELRVLPPILPDGMVVILPNGIGEPGPNQLTTNPQLLVTQPDWLGATAPALAGPNNMSAATAYDLPVPADAAPLTAEGGAARTLTGQTVWKPWWVVTKVTDSGYQARISGGNYYEKAWTRSYQPVEVRQIQDECGITSPKSWIYRCDESWYDTIKNFEGPTDDTSILPPNRPATRVEQLRTWGAQYGWHLLNDKDALQVQQAVASYAVEQPTDFAAPTTTSSKLIELATRGKAAPGGSAVRSGNVALAWSKGLDQKVWLDENPDRPHVRQGWTRDYLTGYKYPTGVGTTDLTACTTHAQVPKKYFTFDVASGAVKDDVTRPLLTAEQMSSNAIPPFTDPAMKATSPVKCAGVAATAKSQTAGVLLVRNLTAQKGDDYLAQLSGAAAWPVIEPSVARNVSALHDGPDVAVTWEAPQSDGGSGAAGQPLTYRVSVRSADGKDVRECPIVQSLHAVCVDAPTGAGVSVRVTASTGFWTSSETDVAVSEPVVVTTTTVAPPTTTAPASSVAPSTTATPSTTAAAVSTTSPSTTAAK